jgi:hypothetical protein
LGNIKHNIKKRYIPDYPQLIHQGIGVDAGFWGLNLPQFLVPFFRKRIKIKIRKLYMKLSNYLESEKQSRQITNLKRVTETTNITKSRKIIIFLLIS